MANPAPKPNHKRRTPTRKQRGEFSMETKMEIYERDEGCCVRCRYLFDQDNTNLDRNPHHIIFKSQLGPGTLDNGVCVCIECHKLAHKEDEVRRWFEWYREEFLL